MMTLKILRLVALSAVLSFVGTTSTCLVTNVSTLNPRLFRVPRTVLFRTDFLTVKLNNPHIPAGKTLHAVLTNIDTGADVSFPVRLGTSHNKFLFHFTSGGLFGNLRFHLKDEYGSIVAECNHHADVTTFDIRAP